MSDFGWPEWTILIASTIAAINAMGGAVRNPKFGSGRATLVILLVFVATVGYWAILSAGGFW